MTCEFLAKASLFYRDICPEESRYLMRRRQQQVAAAAALSDSVLCPFCFQWREPGNHHVRLRPKRRPTAKIRKLLRRESEGRRLGKAQTILLHRFKRASNVLMATCHICNKTSRQPGTNREWLSTVSRSRSTPAGATMYVTPQSSRSTPRSSIDKTPSGTPRSALTNSSSASKSGNSKSSPFARLKKILMSERKQPSKDRLKDFLSSL